MSFHLSQRKWCESSKAVNAAEEGKEIITIVQIRECSYSIYTEGSRGVGGCHRFRKNRREWDPTAKCFNWKSFSLHLVNGVEADYYCGLELIVVWRENLKSFYRWLNDPLNKRNFPMIQFNFLWVCGWNFLLCGCWNERWREKEFFRIGLLTRLSRISPRRSAVSSPNLLKCEYLIMCSKVRGLIESAPLMPCFLLFLLMPCSISHLMHDSVEHF